MEVLIVGGGVTTPMMVAAFQSRARDLELERLVVYDPREQVLSHAGRILRAISRSGELPTPVELTSSISHVLGKTRPDVCIMSIRPGLDKGRLADETLAHSLGLVANETVGAGGLAFACRAIPATLKFIDALRQRFPQALIINFTNPAGMVTAAIELGGLGPALGVCSSAEKSVRLLSRYLHQDFKGYVFGLNHLSVTYSVLTLEGDEYLPTILASDSLLGHCHDWLPPTVARSNHVLFNEYFQYFYSSETITKEQMRSPLRAEVILSLNSTLQRALERDSSDSAALTHYLEYVSTRKRTYSAADSREPALSRIEDRDGYSASAIKVIEGVILGRPCHTAAISASNPADILGRRMNVGIESTMLMTDGGWEYLNPLPEMIQSPVASLMTAVASYEEAAVQAILHRETELLIEAASYHPLIASRNIAEAFVRSYVEAAPSVFADWTIPQSWR